MFLLLLLTTFACAEHPKHKEIQKILESTCTMPNIWKRTFTDSPNAFHQRCKKAALEVEHMLKDEHLSHEEKKEIKAQIKKASYSLKTSYHYHNKMTKPFLVKALEKCGYIGGATTIATASHAYIDENGKNKDITATGTILSVILLSAYGLSKQNRKDIKKLIK